MKLSDFFGEDSLRRDGSFDFLGHAETQSTGLLCYCESIQYIQIANNNPHVLCVITKESLARYVSKRKGLIIVDNPRNSFYGLHKKLLLSEKNFHQPKPKIEMDSTIHESAQVSKKCRIGQGVIIKENVVIGDGVTICDNVFIDVGAVIGSEGILYMSKNGNIETIRHGGGVVIGKGATILSNVVVVKSIHQSQLTIVGDHSIIGIASNIGHDVNLGKNCVVSGNCVIARGALISNNVFIGTSSVIREYVRIGEKAEVKVGSIVVKDIAAGESVSGNFAIQHRKHMELYTINKK